MEVQDALATLGLHRHPDYWKSDAELSPMVKGPKGRGRNEVASQRDRDAEADARIAAAHARHEQRRAAARGEAPAPVWAGQGVDSGAMDIMLQVGVGGAGI